MCTENLNPPLYRQNIKSPNHSLGFKSGFLVEIKPTIDLPVICSKGLTHQVTPLPSKVESWKESNPHQILEHLLYQVSYQGL